MAGNSLPWAQRQEYLDATDLTIRPGAPTVYVVPRRTGNSAQDVTSFHPGQTTWTLDTFSDCMYQLRPPPAWYKFKASGLPDQKLDDNGDPIWVEHPEFPGRMCKFLDFQILPNKIGTKEEWWYFEQVRRLDPRVRWVDILMRMERQNRPLRNNLNNFACRTWRPLYCMISWHGSDDRGNESKAVLERLSQHQKNMNTTRGSTPGWGEDGKWIAHPEARKGRGEPRPYRLNKVYKPYKARKSRQAQPTSKATGANELQLTPLQSEEDEEGEEDRQDEPDKADGPNEPEEQEEIVADQRESMPQQASLQGNTRVDFVSRNIAESSERPYNSTLQENQQQCARRQQLCSVGGIQGLRDDRRHELRYGRHHDSSLDSQRSESLSRMINRERTLWNHEMTRPVRNRYSTDLPQHIVARSRPVFPGMTNIERHQAAYLQSTLREHDASRNAMLGHSTLQSASPNPVYLGLHTRSGEFFRSFPIEPIQNTRSAEPQIQAPNFGFVPFRPSRVSDYEQNVRPSRPRDIVGNLDAHYDVPFQEPARRRVEQHTPFQEPNFVVGPSWSFRDDRHGSEVHQVPSMTGNSEEHARLALSIWTINNPGIQTNQLNLEPQPYDDLDTRSIFHAR